MKYLLLFLALLTSTCAQAQDVNVTLTWDANPEPDISGYRVYWGTATGAYTKTIAIVSNQATLALPKSTLVYIVVTAVNTGEFESEPSTEFVYFVKAPGEIRIPAPPQNVKAPKALNSARVEKSTDMKTWVPIYWTTNPMEFFRIAVTL